MSKKYSYQYIKEQIESVEDYKLLSKTYKSSKTKLTVKCNKGHVYDVAYSHFKQGRRCAKCANETQKHSYSFVKEQIENEGYKLLSEEYKNTHTKLKIQCNKGHVYDVTYGNIQQGHGCAICAGNKKHTYEFVKEFIEKKGYTLLSKTYKSNKDKLKVQCDKGHVYEIGYSQFQQGHGCAECNGKKKYSYEYVKEQIEKEGYTLLSKTYKNTHTKLKIQCDKGHVYNVTYNSFKQGSRCAECSGNKKHTYEFIKDQIEKKGYTLLSEEYKNAHNKLKVQCDKGHVYGATYCHFKQGQRCPICANEKTSSKGEIEIQEYVKTLNVKQINNDRSQILNLLTGNYLELDVYLPELKKAIEYNGIYWHSFPDAIERDKFKNEECKRLGIDLLTIQECDYMDNKEQEMEKIKHFLK